MSEIQADTILPPGMLNLSSEKQPWQDSGDAVVHSKQVHCENLGHFFGPQFYCRGFQRYASAGDLQIRWAQTFGQQGGFVLDGLGIGDIGLLPGITLFSIR